MHKLEPFSSDKTFLSSWNGLKVIEFWEVPKRTRMNSNLTMKTLVLLLLTLQDVMADVTCYTCDATESGQCNLTSHLSEYCGQTDWCVKTWRGSGDDPMSGMLSVVWILSTTQPFWEVKRPSNMGVREAPLPLIVAVLRDYHSCQRCHVSTILNIKIDMWGGTGCARGVKWVIVVDSKSHCHVAYNQSDKFPHKWWHCGALLTIVHLDQSNILGCSFCNTNSNIHDWWLTTLINQVYSDNICSHQMGMWQQQPQLHPNHGTKMLWWSQVTHRNKILIFMRVILHTQGRTFDGKNMLLQRGPL